MIDNLLKTKEIFFLLLRMQFNHTICDTSPPYECMQVLGHHFYNCKTKSAHIYLLQESLYTNIYVINFS
jgi:hypothetical protein